MYCPAYLHVVQHCTFGLLLIGLAGQTRALVATTILQFHTAIWDCKHAYEEPRVHCAGTVPKQFLRSSVVQDIFGSVYCFKCKLFRMREASAHVGGLVATSISASKEDNAVESCVP